MADQRKRDDATLEYAYWVLQAGTITLSGIAILLVGEIGFGVAGWAFAVPLVLVVLTQGVAAYARWLGIRRGGSRKAMRRP